MNEVSTNNYNVFTFLYSPVNRKMTGLHTNNLFGGELVKKIIFLLVLSLVLALAVVGCGETTKPERVNANNQNEKPKGNTQETFNIGETIKMGSLQFTLNGVRFDEGDDFWTPDEGKSWLLFDCTLENTGSESEGISSMLMFKLYDSDSYSQSLTISTSAKGSLDGELAAGRKMAGEVAFEVDADETEWEFIFEPSVFGFGQAIYTVAVDDIN